MEKLQQIFEVLIFTIFMDLVRLVYVPFLSFFLEVLLFHRSSGFAWGFVVVVSDLK